MANVIERCNSKRKAWFNVIERTNATMATENRDVIIAKFIAKGDAYCWALDISKRYSENVTLIID